jgi:Zn-finger in ubiquitin-hydrolases and other protein
VAGITDAMRRAVFQRSFAQRGCGHLGAVLLTEPQVAACEACIREGTRTVHLRMCLTCGEVACCDSSPAKHARRHHELTRHPMIRSIEQNEAWAWCYLDRAYLTNTPTRPQDQPRS